MFPPATQGRRNTLLGTQLFERTRGKLIPTEAGRAVARRAENVEREVEALIAANSGCDHLATGPVRVTAVPAIVNRVLIPALPPLLERYPDLHVELIADPRDFSLTRREADIALRLARPRRELRVIARRIGYMGYAVYGSTGRHRLAWVTYDDLMADLPQARWMAEQIKIDGTVRVATSRRRAGVRHWVGLDRVGEVPKSRPPEPVLGADHGPALPATSMAR